MVGKPYSVVVGGNELSGVNAGEVLKLSRKLVNNLLPKGVAAAEA